jgi:hypothetical protein
MDQRLHIPPHWTLVHVDRHFALNPAHVVYHDNINDLNVEFWSRGHRKRRYPSVNIVHKHDMNLNELSNISFQVALWFTLGSTMWIVNGQYSLFPSVNNELNNQVTGWSALVGGWMFQIGASLAYIESLNEPYDRDFGVWIEDLLKDVCRIPIKHPIPWRYIPISTDWKSMGFISNLIQLCGATLFTVSVIAGVPGLIQPNQWQLQQALWWTPQTIGSICFCISSLIAMLEEQTKWYEPSLGRIGWWCAFWNLVGSLGFLFCAIFGYLANWQGQEVCCQVYGTALSTYWGSWAFLIASLLQLVEVLLKHPQN